MTRKIGGMAINKKWKRNQFIYEWFNELRLTEMPHAECLDVIERSRYNNHSVVGWHLTIASIEAIVKDWKRRKPSM